MIKSKLIDSRNKTINIYERYIFQDEKTKNLLDSLCGYFMGYSSPPEELIDIEVLSLPNVWFLKSFFVRLRGNYINLYAKNKILAKVLSEVYNLQVYYNYDIDRISFF